MATKKVLSLSHFGSGALSQSETSIKKKGGNCSFLQGQAQLCGTFRMQSGKDSDRSTAWEIPERNKLPSYSMVLTQC